MTKKRNLIRSTLGTILSVGLACLIWEAFARSGLFAPALAPSMVMIGRALVGMLLSGAMLGQLHTLSIVSSSDSCWHVWWVYPSVF